MQIQQVIDALGIDWRPIYNPDNDGWVNYPHDRLNSDLGINIFHGGWVDHYLSGSKEGKGDIVALVAMHLTDIFYAPDLNSDDIKEAITWIQNICGINKGISPPDVPKGGKFASEWVKKDNGEYHVRLPISIMQSKLSGNEKIVWSAIFSRCGKDDIYSFAGLSRIGEDTGLSRPTVSKSIQHLIGYGLLIEKFRGHNIAPARFPIVLPKKDINMRIKAKYKSAGKEPLRGVVKMFNGAGKETLPELDTELYTQELYTKAIRAKQVCAPLFSPFLLPKSYSKSAQINHV